MNQLTTGGGISEALKRRYGISDERPVESLATDLFPMLDVADGQIPDLAWTAGVRICSSFGGISGVVAKYSGVTLRNPTGSGVLAVVRSIRTDVRALLRLNFDDPGSVGVLGITNTMIDTRSGDSTAVHQRPTLEPREYSSATPTGVLAGFVQAASTSEDFPCVLVPGTALGIWGEVLNTDFFCSLVWQERRQEKWEEPRVF